MSNVRAAPDWLTPQRTSRILTLLDAGAIERMERALRALVAVAPVNWADMSDLQQAQAWAEAFVLVEKLDGSTSLPLPGDAA